VLKITLTNKKSTSTTVGEAKAARIKEVLKGEKFEEHSLVSILGTEN
jgi:hypothetical protein